MLSRVLFGNAHFYHLLFSYLLKSVAIMYFPTPLHPYTPTPIFKLVETLHITSLPSKPIKSMPLNVALTGVFAAHPQSDPLAHPA